MSTQEAERLIEAGGIVPAFVSGDTLIGDTPAGAVRAMDVDTVTARTYRHPALDDRVVVSLVPAALGTAEDLTMEFLGFALSGNPVEVGTGRRQALGFPAWAVVNDPANGHHALALVKDVEGLARMARIHPGLAKDGFAELAARLAMSVPHFLPTFLEQAGRAFLEADNKLTAAVMFDRAREAERFHALAIDEDRQRDVFLEFAFAGAVAAKSLTRHARDLASRADPGEAYDLFMRLCVERVAGGLPPYAAMAEDLRRLAKAAGLDGDNEDERVLRALLDSPSLPHAPMGFWKAYARAMIRLARADTAVQARLLDIFPDPRLPGIESMWFDLLAVTGALAGLVEPDTSRAGVAQAWDGASGWLERAVQWRAHFPQSSSSGYYGPRRSLRLLQLVERMAPQLHAESRPLDLWVKRSSAADLDLLDLCESLDLEIAVPDELRVMSPLWWVADTAPGRRDLAALLKAGWARELLMKGIGQVFPRRYGVELTQTVTLGTSARQLLEGAEGRNLLAFWLRCLAEDTESVALPGLEQVFEQLEPAALDVVLAVEPEAALRIASADTGRALARTLRMGLLDELGWPALEAVIAEFPGEYGNSTTRPAGGGKASSMVHASPVLILMSKGQVTVVGAKRVLLRHDMRPEALLPSRTGSAACVSWCDGQVLVSWEPGSGDCGYWSGRPSEVFDLADGQAGWCRSINSLTLPLPEGGRTGGGRPIMAGDRTFSEVCRVVGDGTSWWRQEGPDWREFDPQTGTPGPQSLPTLFKSALADGKGTLMDDLCFLAPAPPELAGSPLGTAAGVLGWRAVSLPDGSRVGESVDGVVVRLSREQVRHVRHSPDRLEPAFDAAPAGALQLPGGGPRVGVLTTKYDAVWLWDGNVAGSHFSVSDQVHPYARGTSMVVPVAWWHALQPRDVKGSAALRAVTDEQGRALVASATGPGSGSSGSRPYSGEGAAAVRRVLPEVTDSRLIAGIVGVLEVAVSCARRAQALPPPATGRSTIAATRPEETTGRGAVAATPPQEAVSDNVLAAALAGLSSRSGIYGGLSYTNNRVQVPPGTSALRGLRAAVALVDHPSTTKEAVTIRPGSAPEDVPRNDLVCTPVDWTVLIGGVGAIALRAASESTTDEHRRALVLLLEALLDTPLVDGDSRYRVVILIGKAELGSRDRESVERSSVKVGTVLSTSGGSAVVLHASNRWDGRHDHNALTALEHSPSGTFGAVDGYTVEASRVSSGWGGSGRIRELLGLLRARGPARWRPEAVGSVVSATGLTRAEAALLLAGLPCVEALPHSFLPTHTLETLGLKAGDAKAALPGMSRLPAALRMTLAGCAMPVHPVDLWDHGPDAKKVADTWVRNIGRRADVPDELLGELNVAMNLYPLYYESVRWLLDGLSDPARCTWLTTDCQWSVVGVRLASGDRDGFRGAWFVAATKALLWLAYRLPRESAFRAGLPPTGEAIRQRLANPDLLVETVEGCDFSALRQAFGHPSAPRSMGPHPSDTLALGKAGIITERTRGTLFVRPAFLVGSDDPLLKVAGSSFNPTTAALRLFFDPALERLLESLADTSAGWAQDPLVSAPALVPMAAEALAVDAGAARLYLQMLALPDPTDKNVRRWNGWSLVELKEATAALLDVGALVGGKRPRAGRSAFLPCGWLDVEPPMPSIEAWKVDLLGLVPDGRGPLGVTVPSVPLSELFANAWRRVSAGDGPRYDELETRP